MTDIKYIKYKTKYINLKNQLGGDKYTGKMETTDNMNYTWTEQDKDPIEYKYIPEVRNKILIVLNCDETQFISNLIGTQTQTDTRPKPNNYYHNRGITIISVDEINDLNFDSYQHQSSNIVYMDNIKMDNLKKIVVVHKDNEAVLLNNPIFLNIPKIYIIYHNTDKISEKINYIINLYNYVNSNPLVNKTKNNHFSKFHTIKKGVYKINKNIYIDTDNNLVSCIGDNRQYRYKIGIYTINTNEGEKKILIFNTTGKLSIEYIDDGRMVTSTLDNIKFVKDPELEVFKPYKYKKSDGGTIYINYFVYNNGEIQAVDNNKNILKLSDLCINTTNLDPRDC